MMEWRELLYSFGLIANVLFALRFTLQWIGSELKQKSDLPAYFWRISLSANSIMYIHTLIQLQLNVCLIQAVNAILSWRNLDFMKPKGEQAQFKTVVILLLGSVAATFLLFILQGYYLLDGNYIFIRGFGSKDEALGPAWHLFGTFGFTLFSSRFWLQWWQSEQAQESTVNPSFWWLSLIGALISSVYFYMLRDMVNFIGPALGMIPYLRNLMIMRRARKELT